MMIVEIPVTRTLDVRGRSWPGCRARLSRALDAMRTNEVLAVWSGDEATRAGIPAWLESAGHRLLGVETRDGYDEIFVEKRCGPARPVSGVAPL